MKLNIGVTGINATDNPGPGIGIARSLIEADDLSIKPIGLAYDAMEPGIYMDWLIKKSFILPYPSGPKAALLDRLHYIKENIGLDFIFPNLDAELPMFIANQEHLADMGIKTFLPTQQQFDLRGKEKLNQLSQMIGISCPETKVVTSHSQLVEATTELGFPLMVKGNFYKAHRATCLAEAERFFHKLAAEWGYPIIVQAMVGGDEFNVVGVGDGEGGDMGMVAIKKMSITDAGKIWTGVTVSHEGILEAARQFVKTTRWRGPFELECMIDGEENFLIEINPRFPAWVYFASGSGVNLPAQIIRNVFGGNCESTNYSPGKLFVRYSYELVTDLSAFQKMVTRGDNNEV